MIIYIYLLFPTYVIDFYWYPSIDIVVIVVVVIAMYVGIINSDEILSIQTALQVAIQYQTRGNHMMIWWYDANILYVNQDVCKLWYLI